MEIMESTDIHVSISMVGNRGDTCGITHRYIKKGLTARISTEWVSGEISKPLEVSKPFETLSGNL